jgi:hypothetical protein
MYFMRTTEGRILDIVLILALFVGIIVMVHSCVECKRQLRETPPYIPPREAPLCPPEGGNAK